MSHVDFAVSLLSVGVRNSQAQLIPGLILVKVLIFRLINCDKLRITSCESNTLNFEFDSPLKATPPLLNLDRNPSVFTRSETSHVSRSLTVWI